MEQYNDKNDMLNVAQSTITEACERYVSGAFGEDGLREVLSNIPEALWTDADAALNLITILVEDEGIYDLSLEKEKCFAEFICGFLPKVFWCNRDGILKVTELIVDDLIDWCSYA